MFKQKLQTFINQFEGVKLALPAVDFERGDYTDNQLVRISNSFNFKRSGDVLYELEEGWQPQYKYRRTIYNDNTNIPLIWYGKGIAKTKTLDKIDAVDIVPTLLHVLGYPMPSQCPGRVLEQILLK